MTTLKAAAETAIGDYKTGLTFYQKCQYEKALQYFQSASDEDFNFWQSYQMTGYCYFYLRDKDGAISAFETSLRLHPNNPSLKRFCDGLKKGTMDILLQPVAVENSPAPTPVSLGMR